MARADARTAPALLLAGAEDEKFRALAGSMARSIPRARVRTIPAAGHATHLESPGAFTRAVRGFARGVFEEER